MTAPPSPTSRPEVGRRIPGRTQRQGGSAAEASAPQITNLETSKRKPPRREGPLARPRFPSGREPGVRDLSWFHAKAEAIAQPQRAECRNDCVPPGSRPWGHIRDILRLGPRSVESKAIDLQLLPSAAGRARTCDRRIKSPLLYQLSYGGAAPMMSAARGSRRAAAPPHGERRSRCPDHAGRTASRICSHA
jgi:hypothetical protein